MRFILCAVATLVSLSGALRAEEPVSPEYFEKKVRPILAAHCTSCHGEKKQKGGLRLDSKAEFIKGGETGSAFVAGDAAKSKLIQVVQYEDDIKMPPRGKLAEAEIAVLVRWINGGAPWPEEKSDGNATAVKTVPTAAVFDLQARARAHWSFQPISHPKVPTPIDSGTAIRNPLDSFLLAKLRDNGLSFSPPAEKRTLLRRVTLDLTGLPPTPQELAAFLADHSPDAYEKVVERLLASPAYGQRWGRHWLDLVRYAETYGHEFDFEIPDAWRYRDYVIRAFNEDLPYNQFLTEQIAGDLLPHPRINPKTGVNDSLLATTFWWLGEAKHSPVDSRLELADRIDNQIDVFGKSVLGLTISCARCHDHKFDPIATRDYYSLFSVIASSRYSHAGIDDPTPTIKLLDDLKQARGELDTVLTSARAETPRAVQNPWRNQSLVFERFEDNWRDRWDAAGLAFRPGAAREGYPHSGRELRKLSGQLRSPTFTIDKPLLAIRVAGREARARVILNGLQLIQEPIYGGLAQRINHGEEFRWLVFDLRMWKGQPAYLELLDDGPGYVAIREAWFADSPPPADPVERVSLPEMPAAITPENQKLVERIRELEARIPTEHRAVIMRDGTGINEHVFVRGNPKTPGIEAPRAFLEAFDKTPFASPGSGRLQLAAAVTDPTNPLVARVIVNRIWKHHFGEGIVRSPDDFGRQGQAPTHPELLDWLAQEFVHPSTAAGPFDANPQPWGIKHLHRLMVLSTAYRQSSRETRQPQTSDGTMTVLGLPIACSRTCLAAIDDPLNKLLHRQNLRRLEAEAIRDSMLAVSGRLDRTMEGPGVLPHLTEFEVGRGRPSSGPIDGHGRRSIYLAVRRNFLNPMFTAFDYPTPFTAIGRRSVSNVPAQALVMLNNPFVLQQSDIWAKRVLAEEGKSPAERIGGMYVTAFGRLPTPEELSAATEFLAGQAVEYGKSNHPRAWSDLAHVLFNAKEFIFVE